MLGLNRRIGKTVIIGDNIAIEVLRVKGNQICLIINVPKEIEVHRVEIYEPIQDEKRSSTRPKKTIYIERE